LHNAVPIFDVSKQLSGLAPNEVQTQQEKRSLLEPENNLLEPKAIKLEEVRAKLTSLSQSGKQAEVKELIQKFGAAKLTDIPVVNYAELLKAAQYL
jgi:hypothetical protein